MDNNIIIHVSEVNISPNNGMGRVEHYWKEAFERAGFTFIHIGLAEVGELKHPALFPYKAYKYYKKLKVVPKAFIVHEPAGGYFVKKGIPCFIESHGVERRYWEAQLNGSVPPFDNRSASLKRRLLFPLWRLHGCDKGLKNADKLLLINSDDKAYVKKNYVRKDEDILVFKNGANSIPQMNSGVVDSEFTVLFNGNWLRRKGIDVLVKAAKSIFDIGLTIRYLLIGTGKDEKTVLEDWPKELHPFVKVVSRFAPSDESMLLNLSSLFVLPSYAEGQPLSLLQAMAAAKCCITTDCCGQKDTIKNGITGFLFKVGDHKGLAELIINCYEKPDIMEVVGLNAKNYINDFTWESVSEEVVKFILRDLE
jgi:glycosyltransferase involved in cell wall biosynthesis